jgi:cobalt-zinc-cadmium efflux system outer membrane protein
MSGEYGAIEAQLRQRAPDDSRALNAERLEPRALVRAVLDRNPSAESARQAWQAALARYRQAGSYEDAMVTAAFAPLSIGASRARFGYEVEVSQRIPLGSKLDAQAALAAAEAEAADADFKDTRLELALVTAELYADYVVAVRSLEIQAQHIALMDALKENVSAAYASGHGAAQDSLQAEAELARLDYQNAIYETQRDVVIARLNALLHRAAGAPLPPPSAELTRDDALEIAEPVSSAQTIPDRPDIRAAEARLRGTAARAHSAESAYYPDLTLSASYNSMWDMPEHRFMAGVGLNIPLQRAGRSAALDEAAARRRAAASDVQSMTDAARSEIAIAARQLMAAERAEQLYEVRLVPVARERIEAARSGFIASQNNFMTVIEAVHGLHAAELELQLVHADRSKRRAQLERALGRIPGLASSEVTP